VATARPAVMGSARAGPDWKQLARSGRLGFSPILMARCAALPGRRRPARAWASIAPVRPGRSARCGMAPWSAGRAVALGHCQRRVLALMERGSVIRTATNVDDLCSGKCCNVTAACPASVAPHHWHQRQPPCYQLSSVGVPARRTRSAGADRSILRSELAPYRDRLHSGEQDVATRVIWLAIGPLTQRL
jgi:hypothetical protein